MDPAGLRCRLDPELVAQHGSQLPVGRERPGGLADLPVCPHQQPVRGLVEPVAADGGRGEVHRLVTAPGAQRGLGCAVPGGTQQAPDLVAQGVHPVGLRFPHQRGSGAEQHESPPGRGRGDGGRPRLEPAAGFVDEARRLVDVHARRPQPVSAAVARDDVGTELRAQPAHQRRHVALGALGCPRAQERVDQPFGRDDLTASGGEQRQQPARLGAADHPLGPRCSAAEIAVDHDAKRSREPQDDGHGVERIDTARGGGRRANPLRGVPQRRRDRRERRRTAGG